MRQFEPDLLELVASVLTVFSSHKMQLGSVSVMGGITPSSDQAGAGQVCLAMQLQGAEADIRGFIHMLILFTSRSLYQASSTMLLW
jgi:hypothetical protein